MVFDKKAYNKAWYQKNKEKRKEQMKEYNDNNKEKRKAYMKEYDENNKEKKKEYYEKNKEHQKEYHQTEQGKKTSRISKWKQNGVICNDFDALYNQFINTPNCENCNIELTVDRYNTSTTRCLDHNHDITDTDNFRNILCNSCNIKRG